MTYQARGNPYPKSKGQNAYDKMRLWTPKEKEQLLALFQTVSKEKLVSIFNRPWREICDKYRNMTHVLVRDARRNAE